MAGFWFAVAGMNAGYVFIQRNPGPPCEPRETQNNNINTIMNTIGLVVFLVTGLLSLLCFAFWLWMLVDAVMNKGLSGSEKIMHVLLIIFLPLIGALIYLFVGRPKRNQLAGA